MEIQNFSGSTWLCCPWSEHLKYSRQWYDHEVWCSFRACDVPFEQAISDIVSLVMSYGYGLSDKKETVMV